MRYPKWEEFRVSQLLISNRASESKTLIVDAKEGYPEPANNRGVPIEIFPILQLGRRLCHGEGEALPEFRSIEVPGSNSAAWIE